MKKILFVVGTRPEIIKTASVMQELGKMSGFSVSVCLSGQHISMVEQMMKDFDIDLKYDLKIMKEDQTLVDIAKNLMPKLDEVYEELKPDMVFVQGDTTTAFIAAFLASCKKIKIAHIEAGLRTFDKHFPFPEEMNRTLISRLADRHFAPTRVARENLIAEGVKAKDIVVTGNTGIDSLKYIIGKEYPFIDEDLRKISVGKKVILLTAHRRENFGPPMEDIFEAVRDIALEHEDVLVVYPVHPNPNVTKPAFRMLAGIDNIMLLGSLHYRDLVKLMALSYMIITDSGGIQEEAPSIGKPVLILRGKTERPEAIRAGCARIVGTDRKVIVRETERLLKNGRTYKKMSVPRDVFGTGNAAEMIADDVGKIFER